MLKTKSFFLIFYLKIQFKFNLNTSFKSQLIGQLLESSQIDKDCFNGVSACVNISLVELEHSEGSEDEEEERELQGKRFKNL